MAIMSSEAEEAKFRKKVETSTCCTNHFLYISQKSHLMRVFLKYSGQNPFFVPVMHCKMVHLTHVLRVSPRRRFHSASVPENPIKLSCRRRI